MNTAQNLIEQLTATGDYKGIRRLQPVDFYHDTPRVEGHTKLESTVRYLGIEIDDAQEMAEQTEI